MTKQEAIEILNWIPTKGDEVDAMEMAIEALSVDIVRCKDCKHRDPEDHKCDCGHDILWQLPRADEWFCADGERGDSDDGEN